MTHPFFMGIPFPTDIKPCTGEKAISTGQVRYAIRIIYMYAKNIYLGSTIEKEKVIPIKF